MDAKAAEAESRRAWASNDDDGQAPTAVSALVLPSYQGLVDGALVRDLAGLGYSGEVVQVRTDPAGSRAAVEPLTPRTPVRLCRVPAHTTPFQAMLFGLCYCTGETILLASGGIPVTAQGTAALLARMHERQAQGAVASRRAHGGQGRYPWRRRLLTGAVREYLRLMTGSPLRDPRSGLKLFQRATLMRLIREVHRRELPFDPHDLTLVSPGEGATVVEVPVEARYEDAPYPISFSLARHVILMPLRFRLAALKRRMGSRRPNAPPNPR